MTLEEHEIPKRPGRRLRAYLRRRLRLASAALLWEAAWPAAWPAVLVLGTFLALALFDVLPALPPLLHGFVLLAFAAALIAALMDARKRFDFPSRRAAERRLETESALPHRPLAALDDRPAMPFLSPAQSELWRTHRERMAAALGNLKIGLPRAGLARRDPYGFRVVLAMVLLLAVLAARQDAWRRIERAVAPKFPAIAGSAPALDAWIAPPDYTGLPTLVLAKGGANAEGAPNGKAEIPVPAGSVLYAEVHGGRGTLRLTLGGATAAFAPIAGDSYRANATIENSGRAAIVQNGREIAGWTLKVLEDAPPEIALKEKPAQSERGALRLSYRVSDDFGVTAAKAVINRAGPAPQPESAGVEQPIEFALPLPSGRVTGAENTSYHDLTAEPWAGTEVTMRLEAKDGAGQTGTSESVTFVLPERVFHNEVARQIVALRKQLTLDPSARRPIAEALAHIEDEPDRFHNDTTVYLALRSAIGRLLLDREPAAIPAVQSLLWDTALRLEDNGVSLAQRDLRDIEKELRDALAKGAEGKDIKDLLNRLQAAMERYLKSMMQGAEPDSAQGNEDAPNDNAQSYRPEDLRDMLEKARELAETGDREGARQMLSKLADILENLRSPKAGENAGQSAARATLKGLQDLINRQQQLLDRNFKNAVRPGGNPESPAAPQTRKGGPSNERGEGEKGQGESNDAAEQEKLRSDLGDTMLKFGDLLGQIPSELGRAERAMRDAAQSLKEGRPGSAVAPQAKALDQLQQAMQSARQELAKKGQQPGPGQQGAGKDPLGRPLQDGGKGTNTGNVRVPEKMELRRAREILDELRKRAGESGRPAVERDYIERLLPEY